MAERPAMPLAHLPRVLFAGHYDDDSNVPFHVHAGSEFVAVTGGSCRIDVHGQSLVGHHGSVFVLPQGVPHNQLSLGPAKTTYIVYQTTAMSFSDGARTIDLDPADAALGWFEDIYRLANAPTLPSETALGALLLAFIERLKALEHREQAAHALPTPMAKAIRFIESNLIEPLAVAQIAEVAEVSGSHLTTLFRTHYGCGPLKYQLRLRLALAEKLLGNSYLSIAEVAQACGYEDANYFTRLFRASHLMGPSRWRHRLEPTPPPT
jgi:AraC-like DNA-binding protein